MTTRLPALDGLRAVAILTVVGSHVFTVVIPASLGVTLFFFISGFIITRLLLESHSERLSPFYVRRFFRLGPALVVYVASCIGAYLIVGGRIRWDDIAAALFYYANYHDFKMPPMKTMWSLAVEEHFYVLFPVLLIALRNKPIILQRVLITSLVACLLWRYFLVNLGYDAERVQRGTDTRFDSIAYGCLLSLLFHRAKTVASCRRFLDAMSHRWAFAVGFLLLLSSFVVRDETFRQTLRYSMQGLAFSTFFCAIFWSRTAPDLLVRLLESRPAVFIGAISYSLYLYHEFGLIFSRALNETAFVEAVVALAIGIPATLISYYWVERPARHFGALLAERLENGSVSPRQRAEISGK